MPVAGKTFGRYRPIAELGRGGMAVVYLAASQGPRGFSKLVVVKEMKEEFTADADISTMFIDEARLAAQLSHPNIVQTYEVEEEDNHFFLVMEYLEGQSLGAVRQRLAKLGELLRDHQVRVLCDVLEGLNYAHELSSYDGVPLNVVHRDVSPHNVIITYAGDVKVVDFGIAKTADSTSQTRTGVIKGKLAYMSPEQAFGKKVDRRGDIFAVGVMLWEAITGKRMWQGMAEGAIAHRLSVGDVPKLTDFVHNVPPQLRAVCERALAYRPDDRYVNAAAMRADLDVYIDSLQVRPSARDFGRLISEAFREERARLSALTEEQMKLLRASAAPSRIPKVQMSPAISMTPAHPRTAEASGPITGSGQLAVGSSMRPDHQSYSWGWIVAGGMMLIIVGAVITTALMHPWDNAPAAPTPPPAASTGDAQPPK